ncbi:hypothetical protein GEV33_010120 [Tenebrio molitor]|uniref:Uncharacterized protein n=1 Tax=Tenebrio molitor TaxID=7067 RepID=A0A8J6HDS9_TENMO|nr:hypothetical protein GEV33_010120 [Tenebrio molitor]
MTNRLSRWQRVSQAQHHFWKRWSKNEDKSRKGGPLLHHLPSWILHPGPLALTLTAAAIRGGSNRTTPGDLLPAPTLAAAALLQKQRKQQRRSKIRRTEKVVRPDNDSIPDEVTVSSERTTDVQKMNVFLIPLESRSRRSSLRCGVVEALPRRRSTQDTGLLLGLHHVFTPSHWPVHRPPLTPLSPATVVPSKKPRSGRRECLPQDDEGGRVFKRNSTLK